MNQAIDKTAATPGANAEENANGKDYTSEKKTGLLTKYQRKRAAHDQAVYDRYHELLNQPKAMPTAVQAKVMKEFSIHSPSTVYRTLERVGGSGVEGKL